MNDQLRQASASPTRTGCSCTRCGEGDTAAADLLCARWRATRIEEFGAPGEPRSTGEEQRPN